jgi:hypothetical protein
LGAISETYNLAGNAVLGSVNSSMASNSDGKTRKAVLVANQDFSEQFSQVGSILSALAQPDADVAVLNIKLRTSKMALHKASVNLWRANAKELDRLLGVRIATFEQNRNRNVQTVVMALGVACLIGFLVSR